MRTSSSSRLLRNGRPACGGLNPDTAYSGRRRGDRSFDLTIREGGASGPIVYDRSHDTYGTYNPSPQTVYLGANDAAQESGSYSQERSTATSGWATAHVQSR